ncbi:MAG: hypothetical protein Q7N87_02235 [Candidatus Uhrbacteria bacterium]|nr:hypothetical protein [Candidatus Uhrbacteria bacterium]
MKRMTRRFCLAPAQSILEVVVAAALFAVIVSSLVPFLHNLVGRSSREGSLDQGLSLAQEGLEAARGIRDRDWTALAVGDHGLTLASNTWGFQGTSDTVAGFIRAITVSEITPNERQVAVNVRWMEPDARMKSVTLTTMLADWRNITTGGSNLLSGNWQNPQTLGSMDVGPGNSATALAVRSKIVYLTATASDSKKNDFYIVDATDGTHPIEKGSLNTGPGLQAVAISGNYAYVANSDKTAQLQIIDISNPSAPQLVSSLRLTGNDEEGLSVAASGTTAYIGTFQASGPEFFVVDASDPVNPSLKGSIEVGEDVGDITIFQNRLFLATAKDSGELMVMNVNDPLFPALTATIDILGDSENGTGIYVNVQDHHAYITRTVGGNHLTHHELAIYDVSNPDAPIFLGSRNFADDVNTVFAADNLVFSGTGNSNEEFQIFDVTDPANLVYEVGLNFSQIASDIAFENNIIYVAVRSNDALRIITSQ